MRDSSGKIGRWLNFLSQFKFTVHHRPGNSQEMLVADILSRMIEGIPQTTEEEVAVQLEKPVLRLYKGLTSPVLWHWFSVEPANEEDVRRRGETDKEGQLTNTTGRVTKLKIILKRLQKVVDKEGQDWAGGRESKEYRMVGAEEVEYLD